MASEEAKRRYRTRSMDEQISDAINSMESVYDTMINQPEWLNSPTEEFVEGFKFAMNRMNSRFFPEDVIK